MLILGVKLLHVLSATVYFGAGLMIVQWKIRADRSQDASIIAWSHREIIRADRTYIVPSMFVSPLTGVYLVYTYGLPWTTSWVVASIGAFLLATGLGLYATRLQREMLSLAEGAAAAGERVPDRFLRLTRTWALLGFPAALATLYVFWSMVTKRTFL
jgi:uncharacterized membrane protein